LNRALQEVAGTQIEREEHEQLFNGLPTLKKLELLTSFGRVNRADFDRIFELKQQYTIQTINDLARPDQVKIDLHEFVTQGVGIPIACVTNSIAATAKLMLERTGQLKYMSFLVTNEDVRLPKPAAEGYIQAMVRLSTQPTKTLIIEDSDKGVQAAMASCANLVRVDGIAQVTRENIARYLKEFDR